MEQIITDITQPSEPLEFLTEAGARTEEGLEIIG